MLGLTIVMVLYVRLSGNLVPRVGFTLVHADSRACKLLVLGYLEYDAVVNCCLRSSVNKEEMVQ